MVYKNNDFKTDRKQFRKIIFLILLMVYTTGICSGCVFACKNGRNMSFISDVSFDDEIVKTSQNAIFNVSARFIIRDIILFTTVIIFKYSGILKGLCAAVPFIFALQNGCIYICLHNEKTGILNIIFNYALKDTAIAFLLLIFSFITVNDIICGRENPKKDLHKLMIYITGVLCIYVVDYTVKSLIFRYL